jgi:hypothetical protein
MSDFILLETGDKLLLETGDGLLNESASEPFDVDIFGTVGGGGGSLTGTIAHRIQGVQWVVLAKIFLDSGMEYEAKRVVNHPTRTYEGRVDKWGTIDKYIATPAGLPQTSDARIRLIDTDYRWRNLFKTQTPRRRKIELKFVQVGLSESSFFPYFVGEISDFSFGPGYVEISARDNTFAWLDEYIPSLIPSIYPGVDAFMPAFFGINNSVAPAFGGLAEIPHIGMVGGVDRWGLARHECQDVGVYRMTTGDTDFIAVDPGEYNVTVETTVVDGITYDLSYIDFLVEQDAGTKIRVDVEGIGFRPEWYGYPAEGFDAILNPGGTVGALRNPIDVFILMATLFFQKAGAFDAGRIMAIHEKFKTVITNPSTGGDPYYCDGPVLESTTNRALLGQWLPCFELDLFQTRIGETALNFTDATDASKPLYSDNRSDGFRQLIIEQSYYENIANPMANQSNYFFDKDFGRNIWQAKEVYDNEADQEALAVPILDDDDNPILDPSGDYERTPKIEAETFEMPFVRDRDTAADVVARRMSFLALGSFRQQWGVPAWQAVDDMELTRLLAITHRAGLDDGGYTAKEVKTVGITADLDAMRMTIATILRVPQAIQKTSRVVSGGALASGTGEAITTSVPLTCSDDFNRANGLINVGQPDWVGFGYGALPSIVSNEVLFDVNSRGALCDDSSNSNLSQFATLKYKSVHLFNAFGNARADIYLCTTGSIGLGGGLNCYFLEFGQMPGVMTQGIRLVRVDNGATTQLAIVDGVFAMTGYPYTGSPNTDVTLRLENIGTSVTLRAYVGTTEVLSYTDSSASRKTSGKSGFGTGQIDGAGFWYMAVDDFVSG